MYQQITLVGNLGGDPAMRYTASGVPFASFSLAVNKVWNNQEGQRQEKTIWFRVTTWRKQAETVAQYLTKGSRVLVVGEIEEPQIYTDRDGNPRVSLNVNANSVRFMSGRGDSEGSGSSGNFGGGSTESDNGGVSDEEIPF
jgi:single-strand DNA-binding protein